MSNDNHPPASTAGGERWAVAVLLQKKGEVTPTAWGSQQKDRIAQAIYYVRDARNEDDAKGHAIVCAMKENPGFDVMGAITVEVAAAESRGAANVRPDNPPKPLLKYKEFG
jgi:hypothetical protein